MQALFQRSKKAFLVSVFLLVFLSQAFASTDCSVYFSPEGGCTQAIVKLIDTATNSVLVQAYSFTSRPITNALARASHRRVKVEFIIDQNQIHDCSQRIEQLLESGVLVSADAAHTIAHNKVMIVDDEAIVTGSFNFTTAAEYHNAENVLVIHDKVMAALYKDNWIKHRQHSKVLHLNTHRQFV